MLLIKLQGGLGNQMFQYAAARSLIKKAGYVTIDHDFLNTNDVDSEHFTARTYELNIFINIKANDARAWQVNLFKSKSLTYKILRSFLKPFIRHIQQQGNEYIQLSRSFKNKHLYLDGYFQSEKYFRHRRTDILLDFKFPELDLANETLKKIISNTKNSVSIHIRRGDYLRSKAISDIHGVLPYSYYKNALELLRAKCASFSLFIFSDDLAWAKENFNLKGFSTYFIENNQGSQSWKDMALISCCQHHIIANSSFSWWGAWLSENKGYVFAPINWFNPLNVQFNINDIVPDNWNIIDYE